MSNAMEWLKDKAPGFNYLSDDEQNAITDFSLLWSLFESRVLASEGNARAICDAVDGWHQAGTLDSVIFDGQLAYFRDRYFAENAFTYHFDHLGLRPANREPMLRAVLDGTDADPREGVSSLGAEPGIWLWGFAHNPNASFEDAKIKSWLSELPERDSKSEPKTAFELHSVELIASLEVDAVHEAIDRLGEKMYDTFYRRGYDRSDRKPPDPDAPF